MEIVAYLFKTSKVVLVPALLATAIEAIGLIGVIGFLVEGFGIPFGLLIGAKSTIFPVPVDSFFLQHPIMSFQITSEQLPATS